MCFQTRLDKEAEDLNKHYKAWIQKLNKYQRTNLFNGFTFPITPVIANDNPEEIDFLQWGLIPKWAKDEKIRQYTLNAKIETLHEKPSFRNSVNKRCLVLVDGFYEWKWLDPKGKKKQKYVLSLPNDQPFALAGIWSEWKNPANGLLLKTYSIVTTEALGIMREIHNTKLRQPVMLPLEELQDEWLNGISTEEFAKIAVDLKAEQVE